MSDEIIKDEPVMAVLEEGEPVISEELAEKYNEAVKELSKKKPEVVEETTDNGIIASEAVVGPKKTAKTAVSTIDGTISSNGANRKDKAAPKTEKKSETVAIHSTRNVTWSGVGKVYRGYNIVTKEAAEQWLKRDHTRLATPEEVAKEFNI
jgi:hypothetical protein